MDWQGVPDNGSCAQRRTRYAEPGLFSYIRMLMRMFETVLLEGNRSLEYSYQVCR